MKAEVRY